MEWRIRDFPIGLFRVPIGETIVMTRNENNVFHTGIFGDADPLICIEFTRVKGWHQTAVIVFRNAFIIHDPFAIA